MAYMNTLNSDFETKLRTPSLLASDDESTMGWLVVHSDFESSEKYIQTLLNSNHSYLDPFKCLHSSIRFVDLIEFALLKRIEKLFNILYKNRKLRKKQLFLPIDFDRKKLKKPTCNKQTIRCFEPFHHNRSA